MLKSDAQNALSALVRGIFNYRMNEAMSEPSLALRIFHISKPPSVYSAISRTDEQILDEALEKTK